MGRSNGPHRHSPRRLLDLVLVFGVLAVIGSQLQYRIVLRHELITPWWLPAVLLLAVSALWPWVPSAPGGSRARSLIFVGLGCLLGIAEGTGSAMIIILLGLGCAVIAHGPRFGVLGAGLMVISIAIGVPLWPDRSWIDGVVQALGSVFVLGFMIAFASAYRRAEVESERNRRLVADLADAGRRLRRSSADLREQTLINERARAAAELHDGLGHRLTVIRMGLELAERTRVTEPDRAWAEVSRAQEQVKEALAEMRRWVRALRPIDLDQVRGSNALAAVADSFRGTGLEVELEVVGTEVPLPDPIELALYRAVQEGLTNVVKHAGATAVRLRLAFDHDRVTLIITDDGSGTDGPVAHGFGLTALARRIAAEGGSLTAGSDDQGFRLELTLPLAPLPDGDRIDTVAAVR